MTTNQIVEGNFLGTARQVQDTAGSVFPCPEWSGTTGFQPNPLQIFKLASFTGWNPWQIQRLTDGDQSRENCILAVSISRILSKIPWCPPLEFLSVIGSWPAGKPKPCCSSKALKTVGKRVRRTSKQPRSIEPPPVRWLTQNAQSQNATFFWLLAPGKSRHPGNL